ncbi:CYTH domain-containing protein [Halomonas chromatireducens]|uniref:CYTH domain protein n=1 Tax=Halomonas chromatireducens TaxID=507626 RepID=A0A0X8HF70_9GAMM|nr:CYTH domain-containing protein [Halomonas chromatireducens]AMD01499.1 CYTH domain protein [Halomonas chromatireducens]
MSQEVELKLALCRDGPERLCRHPLLKGRPAATHRLANTYFDTPRGELEAARMALRLRRSDDTWVQTLKTSGEGGGGLSRRGEWEWPVTVGVVDGGLPDEDALDRQGLANLPPMAELGDGVLQRLEARFTTDFERRLWLLDHAGATIEVALDQGEIRTAGHAVPIRELELELKAGAPAALWDLAQALAGTIPLRPADTSKAARGGALLSGHWRLPRGNTPAEWLNRAIMALDALADTRDEAWRPVAAEAMQRLAAGDTGKGDAADLAAALAAPCWLTPAFGQAALRLARRLDSTEGASP